MRERNTRTPRRSREEQRRNTRAERPSRGRDRSGQGKRGGGRKFHYRERSAEDVTRRQEAGRGGGASFIEGDFNRFSVSDGDNLIRILPPTWDDAEHFGLDLYVHYGVGPENGAYLCPKKMQGEECPICDAVKEADADGDEKLARQLAPSHRVLYWVIDRDREKDGPLLWASPYRSIDKEIASQMVDKRTGEVLNIDDPDNGYDVSFTKTGKADRTRYEGVQISRHSSDLGRNADDWLDFITENSLPSILKFVDPDEIEDVFNAGGSRHERDHGGSDDGAVHSRRERSERGRRPDPEPEAPEDLTYEEVMDMDINELCELIDEEGLNINPDDYPEDEVDELAEDVAGELELEPAPKPRRGRRG